MHNSPLWSNLVPGQAVEEEKQIIYIGNDELQFGNQMAEAGFQVMHFNLSLPADLWMKYNALSSSSLPDAIICEWQLNDTNALTLFESLKTNDRLQQVPFIIVGAPNNSIEKIKAFKSGVDDFYDREVSVEDLNDRIATLKEVKNEKLKALPQVSSHIEYKINWVKRAFDIIISATLLLIFSPVMLLIAGLVKLESKGSVFYVSKRVGTGYRIFNFYKFRSMKPGAEEELKKLLHLNVYSGNGISKTSFIKLDHDPRVTRVGKLIRATSLDELPQLINVLKGDMSLVGNRPLPLYEAQTLTTDLWVKRFLAPSGITGLWQISKKNLHKMSEQERKELDVAYADRSSFWFDIKIMLLTVPAILQKERN